jgi:soluble lytic murein transglycosylase-like protein
MTNRARVMMIVLCSASSLAWSQPSHSVRRAEAEYYVVAYGQHYQVPVPLIRALIERESNWRPCAVSSKGAVGLMQLIPLTAERLQVLDRCDVNQNISGGVRYLAWLCRIFHSDYRLVAAAYYAGEEVIARRGLAYHNPDVVAYVAGIRNAYLRQTPPEPVSYAEVFR